MLDIPDHVGPLPHEAIQQLFSSLAKIPAFVPSSRARFWNQTVNTAEHSPEFISLDSTLMIPSLLTGWTKWH